MARTKERSETEHLRATVKKQRSIIKHLKKELARYDKKSHQFEETYTHEEDAQEHAYYSDDTCIKCNKGKVVITDLGIRTMVTCDQCNHREVIKQKK